MDNGLRRAITHGVCAWRLLTNLGGKDEATAAAMRRAARRYLAGALEAFAEWVRTAIHARRAGMIAVHRAG